MAAGRQMTDTAAWKQHPGMEWSELLQGLAPALREAVSAAIQHSASSGWPPSRESIGILVAYAQGRITAREYAVQTLVALGYADAQTASALVGQQASSTETRTDKPTSRFNADAGYDFLFGS